ncbi:Sodium/calcium exchanger protein [Nesidiocoris tenuis]|uniref:Sodium/calcium exchanger protein n=1 Tax=Nesidiocoris tenuis TaxID=355587 RepID=A0ABN7ABE7_9HEMI|nr:Sodium/calcium exchanger protein [Nesidiocoris tenuis]
MSTDGGRTNLQWKPWDNCTYPAILDYPDPGFPPGLVTILLAALCLLACCVLLARICQHYFLPAVGIIVNRWGVKGDVVSAVVFASAASWPELAISVITVFDTRQAGVGIGTIVGTSVFNTLAVPAICAFSISRSSTLDIASMTRDTVMSAISLFLLGIVLSDNMVGWAESSIMLLLYIIYVFVLTAFAIPVEPELPKSNDPFENCHLLRTANKFYVTPMYTANKGVSLEGIEQFKVTGPTSRRLGCWHWTKSAITMVTDAFVWPLHTCLRLIIPPPTCLTYLVVFLGMVYIAVITYVIAWMITILGYKLGIPNSLLSLTILAVGLGYPDLISSLKSIKEGTASGALSNTLGANTFNILVCLGLPWLVCCLLTFFEPEPPDDSITQPGQIYLDADGVTYSVNTMIGALLMFYAALVANRFVLNIVVGYICIFIYIFFVITMSLIEFNVFFLANKPLCNIKDYYNDPS